MVLAYRRQNEESFLDGVVRVFEYFGGVPRNVIFDNGKVAIKDGFGAHARKQAGYAAFAAHYGLEAVFCNPASGNEKGLVKGLVGYIRRNVCVPIARAATVEDLNQMLMDKCRQYLYHHIRGKEASVGTLLVKEQAKLYPPVYCGKEVAVKAGPETIYIYFDEQCIAAHRRCFDRRQNIYTLDHYLPLLEKRGRAILYAEPVRETLPEYFLNCCINKGCLQRN